MSLIMNFEELFEPYTGDGHTLENTLKYLQGVATQNGITNDILELALAEVFGEIADGKEFSKEKCSCGCGIDKAATDLIHAIRDRMLSIDKEKTALYKNLLQTRYDMVIANQMHRINIADKEFVKLMNPKQAKLDKAMDFLKRTFLNGD